MRQLSVNKQTLHVELRLYRVFGFASLGGYPLSAAAYEDEDSHPREGSHLV